MARVWSIAVGPVYDLPLNGWYSSHDMDGAGVSDYKGAVSYTLNALSSLRPIELKPGANSNKVYAVYVGSDTHFFRTMDRGSVSISDAKPAVDINPEQSFIVDSIKDVLSVGAGLLVSRAGVAGLSGALTASGALSAGVGVTIAGAVSSSMPPLMVAGGAVLASQIALNYAQVALASPAVPSSITVNSKVILVRVKSPTDSTPVQDSSPTSGLTVNIGVNVPSNYDVTAQYFDSFPAWNSGQRHQIEGQIINDISGQFKDIIKNELDKAGSSFSPTQENDFDNSTFWQDFKEGLKSTLEATTAKRATDSYKNDLNEMSKSLSKIAISLDNLDIDFPDFSDLFKTYFSIPDSISSNPNISISSILQNKDLSSSYIVVEGGDY